jgi:hypothetical protein
VRLVFAAGFFRPAEVRIKASFLAALASRRLVWVPQGAGNWRDPNLEFLSRQLNQVMRHAHSVLLLHARPHNPDYTQALRKVLDEVRARHPGSLLKFRIALLPRDEETVLREAREWLGREYLYALPRIDWVTGVYPESRMVCVSQSGEMSFATVFKDLGISRRAFAEVGTEIRIKNERHLIPALTRITKPRGPLLLAAPGFTGRIPVAVREEFAGCMFNEASALDTTLAFIAHLHADRHRAELAEAARVQRTLMPASPLVSDGLVAVAQFEPCKAVAGDFYDWFDSPDGSVVIAVADVAGKGAAAGLLAHQTQATIRAAVSNGNGPGLVARRVHEEISRHESYVELFCGFFQVGHRQLTYFYGGHVPPILYRADGAVRRLGTTGTLPGIRLPRYEEFEEEKVQLLEGDRLLIFTDGVSESEDPSALIGPLANRALSPEETARLIFEGATRGAEDDATLLLVCLA